MFRSKLALFTVCVFLGIPSAFAAVGDAIQDGTTAGGGLSQTYPSPSVLHTRCMTIETPADADNFLFFRTEQALTVLGIDCLCNAATSAVMTLQECNANGGACTATEAAMTCGTTNTTETGAIDDAAVAAGVWMRVDVGIVSGTPGHCTLCVRYREP